jgi:hypothetical protein
MEKSNVSSFSGWSSSGPSEAGRGEFEAKNGEIHDTFFL